MPLMERITGRQADFLKRPDGSLVAGVSLVERTLTAIPGIEQMQLVQDSLRLLSVKLVKGQRFDEESRDGTAPELQSVFGDAVAIEIRYVNKPGSDQCRKVSVCDMQCLSNARGCRDG